MSESFTFVAATVLAIAFGWAALAKLLGYERWRLALSGYRLPGMLERFARPGTIGVEAVIAALVLSGPLPVAGSLALAMLSALCLLILRARAARGDRLPCGCFGSTKERDYRLMLTRNAALAVPAAVLTLSDRPGLIERLASIEGSEILPLALVLLAGGLVVWITTGLSESLSGRARTDKGRQI
ncbi:MAG: MauE/DoxX family redox-associated membrane protein [Actinomycetota bacterium]